MKVFQALFFASHISGDSCHTSSYNSGVCPICRAVLSNQNALSYHLQYVHTIRGAATSNTLLQSQPVATATSSPTPSRTGTAMLLNKQKADTTVQVTCRDIKKENQDS